MSMTYNGHEGNTQESSNTLSRNVNTTTTVRIHLMFRRVGEIDTLNEKYQAQASIEARWAIDINKLSPILSPDDEKLLLAGKSVSLLKYGESHWHPQLYIENAIGELKEQIQYSAKKSKKDNVIYICEHRDIKGSFWEKLELQHFPSDVQDLSISVASMLYDDTVVLTADPYHLSGVNQESFVDQQEWKLYEHVDTEQRYVKEFIFQANNRYNDDDDDDGIGSTTNNEDRKRPILTVTCHAGSRHGRYFYWNGYFLVLLISLVAFCIFAIPTNLPQNRIQIACTLLLTSITFRWTVNKSLPTISYLTSLDIYAIFCIVSLVVQCIWHAIIGAVVFLTTPDFKVNQYMWYTYVDRYVFFGMFGIFIIMHIILITWLYLVPFKHRKNMVKKDIEYQRQSVFIRKNSQKKKAVGEKSPSFTRIPIETKA